MYRIHSQTTYNHKYELILCGGARFTLSGMRPQGDHASQEKSEGKHKAKTHFLGNEKKKMFLFFFFFSKNLKTHLHNCNLFFFSLLHTLFYFGIDWFPIPSTEIWKPRFYTSVPASYIHIRLKKFASFPLFLPGIYSTKI